MRRVCIYIYRAARAGYTSMDCNQEQCQERELLFHREIPPILRVGNEWHKLEEYVNWQTGCGNLWELEIRGRARGPRPRSPDWTLRIGKSRIDQVPILFSSEYLVGDRFHLFAHCPLPTSQWALEPLCKVQPPTHTLFTKIQNSFSNNIEHICLFTLSLVLIPLVSSGAAKFLSAQLAKLQQRAQPSLTVVVWAAKQFPPD